MNRLPLVFTLLAMAACTSDGTTPSEEAEQRRAEGEQRGAELAADLRDELLATPSGNGLLAKSASTLHAIDEAAIRQSQLAVDRVRDSDTLALAALLFRDHHDVDVQLDAMLGARDVEPIDHSVTAALAAEGDDGYEMLVAARGDGFAREYVLMQITMQAEALPLLDEMDVQLRDPEVRAVVRGLHGAVERHLTAAIGLASEAN
jgi:predicted outer membrane protein